VKISVSRSGGLAGLTRTWNVIVDDQPDREEWMSLVSSLPWSSRPRVLPQPDRYIYVIRCSRRRITLPEQKVEGPWRELVNRVQSAAS